MLNRVASCLVLASLTLVSGCGDGESHEFAPVSGVVRLDGAPLPDATVSFEPGPNSGKSPPSSFGKTDAQGRYELETLAGDRKGAVIGTHVVRITLSQPDTGDAGSADNPGAGPTLPEKYNVKSELSGEVPASGRQDADFELTSR